LLKSLPLENLPCDQRLEYDPSNSDELRHFEPGRKGKKRKSFWKRLFG